MLSKSVFYLNNTKKGVGVLYEPYMYPNLSKPTKLNIQKTKKIKSDLSEICSFICKINLYKFIILTLFMIVMLLLNQI
jgi:hypothetical protein